MNQPLVTIIIPIYNAEKYIARCVSSCLEQEYTNIELLLINDGSKDASGRICDEFAKGDSRVHVIHKENSGVSDTRNLGIREAKGEYLQFMDADDWITSDATKLLVKNAVEHDCDMVIADFYRVSGEKKSVKGAIDEEGLITRNQFAEYMMENPSDFYYGVLWNKLYRTSIIKEQQIFMDQTLSWCEDFLFNLEYLRFVKTVYVLQSPIYYYVKTKGSLVSQSANFTNSVKMKFTMFEYYQQFYQNVFTEKEYDKKKLSLYRFLIDSAGDGGVLMNQSLEKSLAEDIKGKGLLADRLRNELRLRRSFQVIALKYDLPVMAVKILLYLAENQASSMEELEICDYLDAQLEDVEETIVKSVCYRKELFLCCNGSKSSFLLALQKLSLQKYIRYVEVPEKLETNASKSNLGGKRMYVCLHKKCEEILQDLSGV